jgi:hypothetical protein
MALTMAPHSGVQLQSWSYSGELPAMQPDNIYFVNIASFDAFNEFTICLRLAGDAVTTETPVVRIAVAVHELVKYSTELTRFLASLPAWVTTKDMVAGYKFIEV